MLRWLKRTGPDMDLEFVRLCEIANEEGERAARAVLRAAGQTQFSRESTSFRGCWKGPRRLC